MNSETNDNNNDNKNDKTTDLYTYWYHPESDCLVVVESSKVDEFCSSSFDAGLCEQLTPKEYISRITSVKDLPDGVTGVLKNAIWWPFSKEKNVISGDLYFDRRQRFPDGLNVQTSKVVEAREDGVYVTQHSAYLVQWHPTVQEEIDQAIQE